MSRYCGEKYVEPILRAAQHWKNAGLMSEGSVFGGGGIWTLPNLEDLDKYFINQPDLGEGSFFEKLDVQTEQAVPDAKKLTAEMMWFMLYARARADSGM